jgi:hypothetical protein
MIRQGHRRVLCDHRVSVLAVALMLLGMLGAAVLVSAGSAHHRLSAPVASATENLLVPAAGGDVVHPVSGHRHEHGNDWTPTLGKRLRPAATVAFVGVLPALPAARTAVESSRPRDRGDRLTALTVLRV